MPVPGGRDTDGALPEGERPQGVQEDGGGHSDGALAADHRLVRGGAGAGHRRWGVVPDAEEVGSLSLGKCFISLLAPSPHFIVP